MSDDPETKEFILDPYLTVEAYYQAQQLKVKQKLRDSLNPSKLEHLYYSLPAKITAVSDSPLQFVEALEDFRVLTLNLAGLNLSKPEDKKRLAVLAKLAATLRTEVSEGS